MSNTTINIADYQDYRQYLRDMFERLKKEKPGFSYRSFNRKAGIASSGFMKLVMDGKRNLGDKGIHKVAKGLHLNDVETQLFGDLVRFNQADTHEDKNHFFHKLVQCQAFRQSSPLTALQYNLFSQWYYVAILEVVRMSTKSVKNIRWVSRQLKPRVSLREVNKAVSELKELGLLGQDTRGNLVRIETMLATPDEVQSIAVANLHMQMSELAKHSICHDTPDNRECSSITAAMSKRTFERVKQEIQQFRKKLHAIIEEESECPKSFVGHVQFQQFYLSQRGGVHEDED
jgi:uncharacterized protein (TIGR02147 family)